MKNLPKSKLGAAIAAAYLLPVVLLLSIGAFGSGGLHSGGTMALFFAIMLTLPLSWAGFAITDILGLESSNPLVERIVAISILVVSALFNAALIYLTVGFLSRKLKELTKPPIK